MWVPNYSVLSYNLFSRLLKPGFLEHFIFRHTNRVFQIKLICRNFDTDGFQRNFQTTEVWYALSSWDMINGYDRLTKKKKIIYETDRTRNH